MNKLDVPLYELLNMLKTKINIVKEKGKVPIFFGNIIYLCCLPLEQGYKMNFKDNDYYIFHSNEFYGTGRIANGLIVLDFNDNILPINRLIKKRDNISSLLLISGFLFLSGILCQLSIIKRIKNIGEFFHKEKDHQVS